MLYSTARFTSFIDLYATSLERSPVVSINRNYVNKDHK